MEEDSYYTLQDVANEFDKNKLLANLFNYATNAKVEVILPYYVNSVNNPTGIDFSKDLKALGVTSVFGNSASLTELADNSSNLHLDNYYLSGDISITSAGAINNYSEAKISKKEFESCKVSVFFTRSFMYFIYDNETKLPIYFGIVNATE